MIEFDEPDGPDGPEEELVQPSRRELPLGRRTRRVLTGVAGLGILAAAVVYVQSSHHAPQQRPQAAATSHVPLPATVSPYTPGLLVEHLGDRNGTLRNDVEVTIPARLVTPVCPSATDGLALCAVHRGVPAAVAAAVHARFPTATHAQGSTAVLRPSDALSVPGLWTRTYSARVGRDTLRLLVRRNEMDEDVAPITVHLGSQSVTYVRHVTDRWTVELQYASDRSGAVRTATVAALAADARLTTV